MSSLKISNNVEWGKKRNLFMTQVAKWLKEEQQAFLLNPLKENLVESHLKQKDFVKLFKTKDRKLIIPDSTFSEIKDTICLIWHDKIMPLDYIFG